MEDSSPLASGYSGAELPGWKATVGAVAAVLLAILFVSTGTWKLADPYRWSQFLGQLRVPSEFSLPFAVALGIGETFGAVLIFVPRFRRWGAILITFLLIAFMLYIGWNYGALVGKDCSCFPLVKRTVGPGFFVGDGIMLLMSIVAIVWSRRPNGLRGAAIVLGAVVVFAAVAFGMNAARESGIQAPPSVTLVDGKQFDLRAGHIFLFFYDPECMHCDAAARRMAKLDWKDTKVLGIPTTTPQFAADFLHDTGLKAYTSSDQKDIDALRSKFKFVNAPYGVALDAGRQLAAVGNFDESEPAKTLRSVGFVK